MNVVSPQCPNGEYPERPHDFDTLYVGENQPARLYCKRCGEVRETTPSLVDERPGDERMPTAFDRDVERWMGDPEFEAAYRRAREEIASAHDD